MVSGTVVNLKGKNLELATGSSTRFKGDASLTGLPDLDETFIQLDVENFVTTSADLRQIPLEPFTSGDFVEIPERFDRFGAMQFNGNFTGFIHDFVAYGSIRTDLGTLETDIDLKQPGGGVLPSYSGKISCSNFNLGSYFGITDVVQGVSANMDISGVGFSIKDVKLDMKGQATRLDFNGYAYQGISVDGHFEKDIFSGFFEINDPNASLDFKGDINFSGTYPRFAFESEIKSVHLGRIHVLPDNYDLQVSSSASIDIAGDDIDNLEGSILLNETSLKRAGQSAKINQLGLFATSTKQSRLLELRSDILDANIRGRFYLMRLQDAALCILKHFLPNAPLDCPDKVQGQDFVFEVQLRNPEKVNRLFFDAVVLQPNTHANGFFTSDNYKMQVVLSAPFVRFKGYDATGLEISMDSDSLNGIRFSFESRNLILSDSSRLDNIRLLSRASDGNLDIVAGFKNNSSKKNFADLEGKIRFLPDKQFDFCFSQAQLMVEDSLWSIKPGNFIKSNYESVQLRDITFYHNLQQISFETGVEANGEIRLDVALNEFSLANLNPLLKGDGVSLGGSLNGKASVVGFSRSLVFTSSLGFSDFMVNGERFGNGSMVCLYNTEKQSVAVNARFMRGELPALSVSGFYYPNKEFDNLDFEIQLDKTQLKIFEGYVEGIFSNIRGYASGYVFLMGSTRRPILKGELEVQKGGIRVDYLNTEYSFNGPVMLAENEIRLPRFYVFDQFGKEATFSGVFQHKYFSDISMNLVLDAKNLFCLNTTESMNSMYFGKAFATGRVGFTGDFDNIKIDVVAKTEEGTEFNIPLSGPEEIAETKVIRFVASDSIRLATNKDYKVDLTGIEMNFDLEVTPSAQVKLIFDQKIGDVIQGTGSGDIKLNISPQGDFTMFGDYVIKSGSYLFTLQNVINKKFKINEGGTITWTGDPFQADINLEAVYKLRASLYEVLPSDTSKKRVPVDVKLMMSDKLMNPNIRFDINLPIADERTRNDVRSAINVSNEAELNKQVFALMMLGRFFPPNDRPVTGSLGINQNTSELLSAQLSNWLSQTNEFVNLGVKYRAGDEISSQEFQLAMSTQLFNERLSVDGNFGVSNSNTSASNLVGDVNVEYKLSPDGRFRLRAYYQSNDNTALTNLAPYTQGVGVFYREEFDVLSDLAQRYTRFLRKRKTTPAGQPPADSLDPSSTLLPTKK